MMSDKTSTGSDLDRDKNAAAVQNTLKEEKNEMNTALEENKGELKLDNNDSNNTNDSTDKLSSENITKGTSIRTILLTESQKESCNENNELANSEHGNNEESYSNETCPQKNDMIEQKEISEKSNANSNFQDGDCSSKNHRNDQHEQEEINEVILDKEGQEDVKGEFKEQPNDIKEEKADNHSDMNDVNKDKHENKLVTIDNYKKKEGESQESELINPGIANEELQAGQGKENIEDKSQETEYCENQCKKAKEEEEQNEKKNFKEDKSTDDERQETKEEKVLSENNDNQDSEEAHSKEQTKNDDTDISSLQDKGEKCNQISEQKDIEDKPDIIQDEVNEETNNPDDAENKNPEKKDGSDELSGECNDYLKEQQNERDLEVKVNQDKDVDKQIDDERQENKEVDRKHSDIVGEKVLNVNNGNQVSEEAHSKERTKIDDTDVTNLQDKDENCYQTSEQKDIEDEAEVNQEELNIEVTNSDNEKYEKSEKRDENDEMRGECDNFLNMDKDQENEENLEQKNDDDLGEKVNQDTALDKQEALNIESTNSENEEYEKSEKRDENDYVREECDMDEEQNKESDLEEKGDTITNEIKTNEDTSSEKQPKNADDTTEIEEMEESRVENFASSKELQKENENCSNSISDQRDTEDFSKDFLESKEKTMKDDDDDDGNEADEEDEGEKEENDDGDEDEKVKQNYQGIKQDIKMGDRNTYGDDEESKDLIVNGKEENAEDSDDGDDKQSRGEQGNEEAESDVLQEDGTEGEADKEGMVDKGIEKKEDNEETAANENGCEIENAAGNGEAVKSVPEPDKAQLKNQFQLFSKFGDKSSDGSTIKLSQSDKWFKQAGLIRPRGISTTDTGIAFRKVSKKAPRLSFPTWCHYLEEVAANKKKDVNFIKTKLVEAGPPGVSGGTKVVKSAAMRRLTAVSAFGGTQKERVDSPARVKGKDPIDGTKTGGRMKSKKGSGTGLKKK